MRSDKISSPNDHYCFASTDAVFEPRKRYRERFMAIVSEDARTTGKDVQANRKKKKNV